jgi:hypothetical protein
MDFREIVWEVVDYIYEARDREQWRVLVNAAMSLHEFHKMQKCIV